VHPALKVVDPAVIANDGIEVSDFGYFSLHYHQARARRSPKTGETLNLSAKIFVLDRIE
jgi:nucleoid DNA-binding protein